MAEAREAVDKCLTCSCQVFDILERMRRMYSQSTLWDKPLEERIHVLKDIQFPLLERDTDQLRTSCKIDLSEEMEDLREALEERKIVEIWKGIDTVKEKIRKGVCK